MQRIVRISLGVGFALSTFVIAMLTGIDEIGFLTGAVVVATIYQDERS